MGLLGEDRRRVYEEERVREEARKEIHRERKQKQFPLGSLGIIAIVLAVGLAAILTGCGKGESTPETTTQTNVETAPVPESSLAAAAQAKLPSSRIRAGELKPLKMLEFVTLRERPLEGGGIGAEILVDLSSPEALVRLSRLEGNPKRNTRILGEYILWQVWPKKHFTVLVYDNKAAWEARGLCEQAHEGQPAAKLEEIEGGPICTRATQLEKEHLLMTISRNPSTFQAESLWVGPDQP